ncbi:MAG: dicarboxylate/amino acid:cation symporter [Bacteroidota bacterium]
MKFLRIPLHIQVILSMLMSLAFSYIYLHYDGSVAPLIYYLQPLGTLFINSLQLVVVPLIFTSLIVSINSIQDTKKLTRIGLKTIGLYLLTTLFAVSLGVGIGAYLQPGSFLSARIREILILQGSNTQVVYPVSPIARFIPENIFQLLGSNVNLLQIVLFAILCGIIISQIKTSKSDEPTPLLVALCEAIRDTFMQIMSLIMHLSPIGIFGMITSQLLIIGEANKSNIMLFIKGLIPYTVSVIGGLLIMIVLVYPLLVSLFTRLKWGTFMRYIYPAQLVGFSTSSSTAALRTTSEQVDKMGVARSIHQFVLPIGAVINIDGTALYQGVAIMFITQSFGLQLSWTQQLAVVIYVTLASVGEGGLPGGSLAGTAILLNMLGIPQESGLALIYLPDRILDMCRTATNITGDAAVATLIASMENKLKVPNKEKNKVVSSQPAAKEKKYRTIHKQKKDKK